MSSWVDQLELEIKDAFGKGIGRRTPMEPILKPAANNNTLFLFIIIAVLAAGVFVVYQMKNSTTHVGGLSQGWQYNGGQQNQGYQQQGWSNNPWQQNQQNFTTDQKVDMLRKQYENVDLAAQKIWERTKWNSDRITMLATVNNHNLVVMQQGFPRSEIILLNEDWTINRMPDRIRLDATDQEFMKKFIKR